MESNSVSQDNGIIELYFKMPSATTKIAVWLCLLQPWSWNHDGWFFFVSHPFWIRPESELEEYDTLGEIIHQELDVD